MKALKKIKVLTLATLMVAGAISHAEEVSLPSIQRPSLLEEGTQRELSPKQIEELLPWAKDSKIYLSDLLDSIDSLSASDKVERLKEGIKSVLAESGNKNSELFMRYILSRSLVIRDTLAKEMDAGEVGSIDVQLRIFQASINMAIKYYDIDMAAMSKKAQSSYVAFGSDYFYFLVELNKSVFDASAQYALEKTSLEWLQWDLYRDLNNKAYAGQIVKINNMVKSLPKDKISDKQAISLIREMKGLIRRLNFEPAKHTREIEAREEDTAISVAFPPSSPKDEDPSANFSLSFGKTKALALSLINNMEGSMSESREDLELIMSVFGKSEDSIKEGTLLFINILKAVGSDSTASARKLFLMNAEVEKKYKAIYRSEIISAITFIAKKENSGSETVDDMKVIISSSQDAEEIKNTLNYFIFLLERTGSNDSSSLQDVVRFINKSKNSVISANEMATAIAKFYQIEDSTSESLSDLKFIMKVYNQSSKRLSDFKEILDAFIVILKENEGSTATSQNQFESLYLKR